MPIRKSAADCNEDYCDQLQKLVSTQLKVLKTEYQPSADQWADTVRKVNILANNLVAERQALEQAEKNFQDIWDAMAGKENDVRDEALKRLDWYGVEKDSAAVDPVAVYLKGPLEKALREIEKCNEARAKMDKALWATIDDLPTVWRSAVEHSTTGQGNLPEVVVLGAMAAAEALTDALDFEVRAEPADSVAAAPTEPALVIDAQVIVVGSLAAESAPSDMPPTL